MKKRKPKSRESQLAAWRRWAKAHPDKAQANRDKWAKSRAGRAWLAANQAKKNKARDKWRARKKREALLAAKKDKAPGPQNSE